MLKCEVVAKAFRSTKVLPGSCTAMLGAIIPSSLGVAPAERHESQVAVVEMLARALAKLQAPIEERIAEAEKQSLQQGEAHEQSVATAEAAATAVSEQVAKVEAQKAAVESLEGTLKAEQAILQKALAEQQKIEEEQRAASAEKELCESAERDHLAALREATWEDAVVLPPQAEDQNKLQMFAAAAKPHVDALLPLCTRLGVEDSMIQALPVVASRPRGERGSFDVLALTEVGKRLLEHAAARATELETHTANLATQVAKVEAAKGTVQAAEAARAGGSEALGAAQEERSRLEGEEKAAQQALRAAIRQAQDAEKSLATGRKQLATFTEGPLAAFEALRTWEQAAPEPEAEEAAPEAEEAAPVAEAPAAETTAMATA